MNWAFSGQQNQDGVALGPGENSSNEKMQLEELNQRVDAYKNLLESHDKQV